MSRFWLAFLIVMAAGASAVPSYAALHPRTAALDIGEEDLAGSGREARGHLPQLRAAATDNAGAALADARRWRNLAARARRAAGWVNVRDEALLTRLAEEYEARAAQAERRQSAHA
ncbi:MAG TPA: hypothetical protein VJ747_05795 [Stellaceae bacterium]|nr:hypothetical protein [Stellaceae bacterium]